MKLTDPEYVFPEWLRAEMDRRGLSNADIVRKALANGFVYRAELASCDGQIDTTKLSPGTAIRGELGFEIPKGATPKTLKMATDPFEQNSVSIPIE